MNIDIILNKNNGERVRAPALPNWLLSHGISSVTTEEIATILGVPTSHVPARLAPLRERGEIVSPASGLWLPVSPEYSSWGAPPAIEIINAMMRHFQTDYYVGWLSAAALHGASHHAPQVFQVATFKAIRNRQVGRSRIYFYQRNHVNSVSTFRYETRAGTAIVSSRETTLMDLASNPLISGGLNNVANILIEFHGDSPIDTIQLSDAATAFPAAAIRRLGWLMEHFLDDADASPLFGTLESRTGTPSFLSPSSKDRGPLDRHWNLYINTEVEPDL